MDIDLDFKTTFIPTDIFKQAVAASMVKKDGLVKHNCGFYLQSIPVDSVTGFAAIPYDCAAEFGYFKIDFLHLSLLDQFSSKEEIRELLKVDPDWNLLLDEECVVKLFQLGKHCDLLKQVRPTSIIELADCVALIRPSKRQLLNRYLHDKETTRPLLYRQGTDDKSSFLRSHAIAYALSIKLQMLLISAGKL